MLTVESPTAKYNFGLSFLYTKDNRDRRVTTAKVFSLSEFEEPKEIARGEVTCSKQDNFDKVKGRKVALARALEIFPRNVRREIWYGYFEQCN